MTALVLALAGLGVVIGIYIEQYYQADTPADYMEGVFWPNPKQLEHFEMVDQYNEAFGLDSLIGNWTLMFFGYTSCPDVCPITMAVLNEVSQQISMVESSEDVEVIFITVDPQRDSMDKLEEYVAHFSNEFTGLGGTLEQLDSLASQIGITYFYEPPSQDGSYLVNHTSSIFMLDPDARLVTIFSPPFKPEEIQSRFFEIVNFLSAQD